MEFFKKADGERLVGDELFEAGVFALLRLRLRDVPPDFHINSCFTFRGAKTAAGKENKKSNGSKTKQD